MHLINASQRWIFLVQLSVSKFHVSCRMQMPESVQLLLVCVKACGYIPGEVVLVSLLESQQNLSPVAASRT